MGWHIQAGKKRANIGYLGYLLLLKEISIIAKPESEPLFNVIFANLCKPSPDEWEELYRILPEDIVRFFTVDEVDTVHFSSAMSVTPLLDKLENLNERAQQVREVFRHARRYRAHIHIS